MVIPNQAEREDQVVETCVLWPDWKSEEHLDEPAGVVQALCDEILRVSGVGDPVTILAQHEERVASNVEAQMEAVVEHVFGGGGNFARYQDMSPDEFYDTYSRAAFIATRILEKPVKITSVEEQPAAKVKPKYIPPTDRAFRDGGAGEISTTPAEHTMAEAQALYERNKRRAALRQQILAKSKSS
jgi:hypothetical protein